MARIKSGVSHIEMPDVGTKKKKTPYHRTHKTVACKVTLELHEKLTREARRRDISLAALIREIVLDFAQDL